MVFRHAPIPQKGSGSNNNTSPTSENGQNFFDKLLFESNNLCGSGRGRIFALPQEKDRFRFHIFDIDYIQ